MIVRYPAPAKLNLFLHVVGRRDDGYHLLQTAFTFIDRRDYLSFALRDDGMITRAAGPVGIAADVTDRKDVDRAVADTVGERILGVMAGDKPAVSATDPAGGAAADRGTDPAGGTDPAP